MAWRRGVLGTLACPPIDSGAHVEPRLTLTLTLHMQNRPDRSRNGDYDPRDVEVDEGNACAGRRFSESHMWPSHRQSVHRPFKLCIV